MIISSYQAGKIVANHAVLAAVPELLGVIENYKTAERLWATKVNCPKCKRAEIFAPAEIAALNAITNLPAAAIEKLKGFLGEKELFVYENVRNGAPRTKQL